jgi:hypothetical protein
VISDLFTENEEQKVLNPHDGELCFSVLFVQQLFAAKFKNSLMPIHFLSVN